MHIIDGTEAHLAQVLNLNENAVPHVNSLTMDSLDELVTESRFFKVVLNDQGDVAAFLLTMDETADYQSPNYQYFLQHYESFLYVDRIVVSPGFQGQGIGRRLYDSVISQGDCSFELLTCEVNLRPPNPDSLAFHSRCGFVGVGEQDTEAGTKRVLLMAKKLEP